MTLSEVWIFKSIALKLKVHVFESHLDYLEFGKTKEATLVFRSTSGVSSLEVKLKWEACVYCIKLNLQMQLHKKI